MPDKKLTEELLNELLDAPNIDGYIREHDFAAPSLSDYLKQLLREKEVAIIPGSAFGASGEGYARISYAYSVDHLQTAMKRIREFLTEHGWMKK